jgi:hypothetical protein
LLENGVSMHKFLTIDRLEELYNTVRGWLCSVSCGKDTQDLSIRRNYPFFGC